jgi:hypothetical protein
MNATATVRAANRTSSSASVSGLDALSRIVTARIGPNSPTAPAAVRKPPNRVPSRPRSRSIGSSVPIAVVVMASPISRLEITKPSNASNAPIASPPPSDTTQAATPRFSGGPLSRPTSIS